MLLVVALVDFAPAFGIVVAEPGANFVAGAGEETAIIIVVALRLAAMTALVRDRCAILRPTVARALLRTETVASRR